MKNILFLLLLIVNSIFAQVSNGSEQEFDYGIKNNSSQTMTSVNYLVSQGTDGTYGKITPANLPVSTATTNALELETDVSAGAINGFALTNNGDGTVNIASGTAFLRTTNDPYAQIIKYPISAVTNLALTDNANNFVLVDYNGGSPTLTVTTNASTINTQTNSLAYVIARVGNDLEYLNLVGQNVDPNAKLRIRFLNQEGIRRASGAVLGFSNRNLTLTSSVLFSGLIRINAAAFNTASPDTFTLAYNNGSVWTRTTGQTQVNNTQYNVSGTLTTMPNNTFRTDYVYLLPNNPSKLYVIMGNTTYGSLTLAKGAPRPSSLPVELQVLGLEVGRLFIEKNSAAIAEVQSSFANDFIGAAVPEHNSLTGLQGGTSGEYNHLTNAQVALVNASKTLQYSYNNGNQITTTPSLGAVTIRQGSGADTDNILVGQNGAGANTFSVTGNGNITGGTYNGYIPETPAIKSNESLTGAKRKGDVLYGIIDQYTGEEITLSKVTGTPTVDGVIYFQLGAEYFKRNVANMYNSEWWGLSTLNTSANNTTALQTAIDLVVTLDNPSLIERKSIDISLPSGDIQIGSINFKGNVHIKGAGKTATRLYYNGSDYLFKGDTANIMFGGVSDLTMVSNNSLNKGFIYMFNCINMTFDNFVCNAAVFGSQILEHSIKLESKEDWFIGANNNIFNVTISNFDIKGGVGDGIHVTGDFGTAQLTVKDGVIEAMDNNAIFITTTSLVFNSGITVDNVILQGYGKSGVVLQNTSGFEFKGYFEQVSAAEPAVILGGTKFVRNVRFHNSSIGTSGSYSGAVFKSGPGLSFGNTNIILENLSIYSSDSLDILIDLPATNVKIKNIHFSNSINLNIFKPYDKESGNYEIDLGNLEDSELTPKETLMDCPIPNGMISYFRGASLINTSIRRQKTISGGSDNVSQHDINSDIRISDRVSLSLGNKSNYYVKRYSTYRLTNIDASDIINVTVISGTINGLPSFDILPNESYDVTYDGISNFEFTPVHKTTAPTATAGTNTTQIATTAFVQAATGGYLKYVALLTQTGTGSPTATVLENTLGGTLVWTRSSTGIYLGTLSGVFTNNKTSVSITNGSAGAKIVGAYSDTTSTITVGTVNSSTSASEDDVLFKATIEIRVYP